METTHPIGPVGDQKNLGNHPLLILCPQPGIEHPFFSQKTHSLFSPFIPAPEGVAPDNGVNPQIVRLTNIIVKKLPHSPLRFRQSPAIIAS
jgi:hypothetical protein